MSGRIRIFWLILAVLFAGLAGLGCFYAGLYGSIWNQPDADPAETVTQFFEAIRTRNYPAAYACLSDYASLGLENEPEKAEAKQVYDAMRNSFGYTLSGSSTVSGLEATQRVVLHTMNLNRTEEAVRREVNGVLEELIQTLPTNEVYEPGGGYLAAFTDRIYAEALNRALQNTEALSSDTQLEIQLKYQDGMWKIVTDRSLMNALTGGEN